jgi:hypothetical protein
MSSIEQQNIETDLNNETSGQLETDQQALDNEAQERADSVADGGGDAGNRSMTSSAYDGRADFPNAPDAKEHFNEAAANTPEVKENFSDAAGGDQDEIVIEFKPDQEFLDRFEGPENE